MGYEQRLSEDNQFIGYSYAITEGQVVSTTFYDVNFDWTGEKVDDAGSNTSTSFERVINTSNNHYTEKGSFTDTTIGIERTFEYNSHNMQ